MKNRNESGIGEDERNDRERRFRLLLDNLGKIKNSERDTSIENQDVEKKTKTKNLFSAPLIIFGEGEQYNLAGKNEEGEKKYREQLKNDPNDAESRYNLALCLWGQKKYEEAEMEFREALKMQPYHPFFHKELGLMLYELGRKEEGYAELKEGYFHQYYSCFLVEHNEAEAKLKEMIRIGFDIISDEFCLSFAKVLFYHKKYDDAEREYSRILKSRSINKTEVYWNLGRIYFELDRYDEAEKHFKKSIELDPGNSWSYGDLAELYHYLGRTDDILSLLEIVSEYKENFNDKGEKLIQRITKLLNEKDNK